MRFRIENMEVETFQYQALLFVQIFSLSVFKFLGNLQCNTVSLQIIYSRNNIAILSYFQITEIIIFLFARIT